MISSAETVESGLPRRPRSLTQASVGSIHAFSMFGSVDSEQSLPRTAPLATPEQVFIFDIFVINANPGFRGLPRNEVSCSSPSRTLLNRYSKTRQKR